MALKIGTPSGEITCYGKVINNRPTGKTLHRLADGSITTSETHTKESLIVDIEIIKKDDLLTLLTNANAILYYYDFIGVKRYFRILGNVQYHQIKRFPDYFSASFKAEEA